MRIKMYGSAVLKKKKQNFAFQKARIREYSRKSKFRTYNSTKNHHSSNDILPNPLTPILRSLAVFGLYTSSAKSLNRCCKILRFAHIAFVYISLHYFAFLYLSFFIRKIGTWKHFNQAMIIWTSTLSYNIFLFHRKNVRKFVSLFCYDKLIPISKTDRRKYKKIVSIISTLVWIYMITWVSSFLGIPTKKLPELHFSKPFYRVIANRTSDSFQKYLIQLNDGYLCLVVEGNFTFHVIFYIIALYGCILWFQAFEKIILTHSRSGHSGISDIRYVQWMYGILESRVKNVDDAFCMSVLFWYFMVTVLLCIRVITILGEDNKKVDAQGMLNIGFGLSRGTFGILLGTSFIAQHLIDTARDVVLKMDKLVENSNDSSAQHSYSVLLRKVEVRPVIVTLWRFCPIGKSFLMTCVQTMTTYVVISLQMSNVHT